MFSQKPQDKIKYTPGREIQMAKKIIALSQYADNVIVMLTGGEPLLADHIIEVLDMLTQVPNISITVITNLRGIDKMADRLAPYLPGVNIAGSLHVKVSQEPEIKRIIDFINIHKEILNITLSQVDYQLGDEEREKLAVITSETGLNIEYQPFIKRPWTEDKSSYNRESEENKRNTAILNTGTPINKRCCLGYSHFLLMPSGFFYYDLWCDANRKKEGDFLNLSTENFDKFILNDMKKCPKPSCGCNYNLYNYHYYLEACKRLGYPEDEIFK